MEANRRAARPPLPPLAKGGSTECGCAPRRNLQFAFYNSQFSISCAPRWLAVALLLATALIFASQTASAEPPELVTIERSASSPPIRSDAPTTFLWSVRSISTSLIEGQLEVTVRDGPTVHDVQART